MLCGWLGVSHRVLLGRLYVLLDLARKQNPDLCTTVQWFTNDERCNEVSNKQMHEYDERLKRMFAWCPVGIQASITGLQVIPTSSKVIDPFDKENVFQEDIRVIDDVTLKNVNAEATSWISCRQLCWYENGDHEGVAKARCFMPASGAYVSYWRKTCRDPT